MHGILGGRMAAVLVVSSLLGVVALGGYYLGLHEKQQLGTEVAEPPARQWSEVKTEQPTKLAAVSGGLGPDTIADVAEKVSPSVVNIDVFSQEFGHVQASPDSEFLFNGRQVISDRLRVPSILPVMQRWGTGSGVVISSDGYILTGNHVIKGGDRLRVTLSSQRSFPGKVVGRDSLSDLAVIKIPVSGLKVPDFGSSRKLRPGQWAIAIGSPLGLPQTVTLGIISAIGRSVADVSSEIAYIQTDAAINPGNSGGPLLNLQGQVVGINSFIRSDAQKIGFATPIETAQAVSAEIIAKGDINHAWAGLKMITLSPALKARAGLPESLAGAMIVAVIDGGPASLAGLKRGDIIVKVEGAKVSSVKDISTQLKACRVQQTISFNVWRQGHYQDFKLKLVAMPDDVD